MRAPIPRGAGALRPATLALALLLALGCGGEPAGPAVEGIKLGVNAALSGEISQTGEQGLKVMRLAVDEINAAGGIAGRPLELVVVDNGTSGALAGELTAELVARGEVAAILGPEFSGGVEASIPAIRDGQTVMISSSSTAPDLAEADDGGYLFRNVPNDDFQAIAMSMYLRSRADPAVDRVALVYQDDAYGRGLAQAFAADYRARGGTILGEVVFPPGLDDVNATWQEIVTLEPAMVVLITFTGDGAKLVQRWDDTGQLLRLEWFFTDGVRDSVFVAARPEALEGMRGTAPSHATGVEFEEFAAAFQDRYGQDISQDVFMANVYDAVYLAALGLAAQAERHPGEPLGGARLREAIVEIAGPPGEPVRASQLRAALARLAAGGELDYVGAAGPSDFDARGEARGPYEIWRVADGRYVVERVIEADELVPADPSASKAAAWPGVAR